MGTQTSLKSRALWGLGKECTQPPGHNLRRHSIQVTGQLSTVSALPGSQSKKHQKNQTYTHRETTPALELISEDDEPHTDAAGSAFTFLLHTSPSVLPVLSCHLCISRVQNKGQPLSQSLCLQLPRSMGGQGSSLHSHLKSQRG